MKLGDQLAGVLELLFSSLRCVESRVANPPAVQRQEVLIRRERFGEILLTHRRSVLTKEEFLGLPRKILDKDLSAGTKHTILILEPRGLKCVSR